MGADLHRHDALSAGYKALRVEGYQVLGPPPPPTSGWYRWPRQPPAGCPFQNSTDLAGIEFNIGVNYQYGNADT